MTLVRQQNTGSGIKLDCAAGLSGVTQAIIPSEGPYQPLWQWGTVGLQSAAFRCALPELTQRGDTVEKVC